MKITNGFISNSSSSSFIIIGYDNYNIPDFTGKDYIIGKNGGEYEFGWECTTYNILADRVNFATIQAMYLDKNSERNCYHMIEKVLKETLKCVDVINAITLEWNDPDTSKVIGYIDHQSAATEGENVEMFESEESLYNFLFSDNSYIQGGNDNEDC